MQLLTVTEVAARLRISLSSAYDLIQRGAIPCHRVGPRGGAIRVNSDDLESYLLRCRQEIHRDNRVAQQRPPLKHLRV